VSVWSARSVHDLSASRQTDPMPKAPSGASFVGSRRCVACHTDQGTQWSQSKHQKAIADANEQNVLGNFDKARFAYAGTTPSSFGATASSSHERMVPDGKLADFEVKYTFGVQPLQQYLIELPGGRMQALSIAWDTRPKNENGRRWFHL